MAREKPAYRINLEDIIKFTGGKRLLSVTDTANYLGITRNTVRKRYAAHFQDGYISAATLASVLSS